MLRLPRASTRVPPAPVVEGMVSATRVVTSSIVVSTVSADSTTAPICASTAVNSANRSGASLSGAGSVMSGPYGRETDRLAAACRSLSIVLGGGWAQGASTPVAKG